MLNIGAGSLRLTLDMLRYDGIARTRLRKEDLIRTFRTYHRYPLYSTPEALANIAGLQIPVLFIAAHAGAEAGFLLLAQQIMTAPMTLLGSSISQVYISRAPGELQAGRLAEFTATILRRLMQVGIAPLILIGLIAPHAFPLIFGAQWIRAGEIVSLMVPWIILQFLASPVSMVLHVTGRQHWALMLQVTGLIFRILPLLVITRFPEGSLVPTFIAGSALFYALYLWVIMRAAGVSLVGRVGRSFAALLLGLIAYGLIIVFLK